MTHDPLCQVQSWSPLEQALDGNFYCQCDLISKVEERSFLAQIDHYNNGWEMAVAEIRQIVEFAAHKSDCVCYCCRCIQDNIFSSIDSLKGGS